MKHCQFCFSVRLDVIAISTYTILKIFKLQNKTVDAGWVKKRQNSTPPLENEKKRESMVLYEVVDFVRDMRILTIIEILT